MERTLIQKHPKNWKSEDPNIFLCLMVHESIDMGHVYKLAEFGLNEEQKRDLYDLNKHFGRRNGTCPILWYTLDHNHDMVRIGTTANLRFFIDQFESWSSEMSIDVCIASEYCLMEELCSIKQNFKRICAFNLRHGNGYKLLDMNLC